MTLGSSYHVHQTPFLAMWDAIGRLSFPRLTQLHVKFHEHNNTLPQGVALVLANSPPCVQLSLHVNQRALHTPAFIQVERWLSVLSITVDSAEPDTPLGACIARTASRLDSLSLELLPNKNFNHGKTLEQLATDPLVVSKLTSLKTPAHTSVLSISNLHMFTRLSTLCVYAEIAPPRAICPSITKLRLGHVATLQALGGFARMFPRLRVLKATVITTYSLDELQAFADAQTNTEGIRIRLNSPLFGGGFGAQPQKKRVTAARCVLIAS